jgi:hypothetical protein
MKILNDYSEREYYRNKYLAVKFRKLRMFKTAFKYYTIASIHLEYFKLTKNNEQQY